MANKRRAIGVVRVSRVGGRDGEQFVSPSEQRDRIAKACERDGLELLDSFEELDVSGGLPLAKRPGLGKAMQAIEAGEADVLVVAYFDRLVRSLPVQSEIVERVERAGGAILAVDIGQVSHGSSGQWLSGTMLGAVNEYTRRVIAERTADAKRRAVARGVPPFALIPPGYERGKDGRIYKDKNAAVVLRAFEMRDEGASLREIRRFLLANGIERSFHAVVKMLRSRFYLGELRFGDLVNTNSHEAIVSVDLWNRVQRTRSSRGRRGQSDRLLARLGVLRCASCGSRMVVSTYDKDCYVYRCSPVGDCQKRMTITASIAEDFARDEVKRLLAKVKGTADLSKKRAAAQADFAKREADLDAAVRAFDGTDVEATRERLAELREARDRAEDRLREVERASSPALSISAGDDWERLTLDERRDLVRALIARINVGPGRGVDRLNIEAL